MERLDLAEFIWQGKTPCIGLRTDKNKERFFHWIFKETSDWHKVLNSTKKTDVLHSTDTVSEVKIVLSGKLVDWSDY